MARHFRDFGELLFDSRSVFGPLLNGGGEVVGGDTYLLANDDGTNDVKARVAWTDGSNNIQSYLCYDMVIPAESTVELCEKPKYLAAGYKLRGYANVADRLEITASGKQITS